MKMLAVLGCTFVLSIALFAPSLHADTAGIILIDRTGSMGAIRPQTGETRCHDAKDTALADIDRFFASQPATKHLAVWTFHGTSFQKLTVGFVGYQEARDVVEGLSYSGCSGSTPLAESMCAAADTLRHYYPTDDRTLFVSSDGAENSSGGECDGPNSSVGPPYDDESWERKVTDKLAVHPDSIVVNARYWGALSKSADEYDVETDEPLSKSIPDHIFFEHLCLLTGGQYNSMADDEGGACCQGDSCSIETQAECLAAGGEYLGDGTYCTPNPCVGACCDGVTCSIESEEDCATSGGLYLGTGTECDPNFCAGACCLGTSCDLTTEADCSTMGGDFKGYGTTCSDGLCMGACCEDDSCSIMSEADCIAAAGDYRGDGTDCTPNPCGQLCWATGDLNEMGGVNVDDLTLLISIVSLGGDTVGVPLFEGDLNGDCALDSADVAIMNCALFVTAGDFVSCGSPTYPVPTCCATSIGEIPDTADAPLGNADVDSVGDTTMVCNIGSGGMDGIRLIGDDGSQGMSMSLLNVDMNTDSAGIKFKIAGELSGVRGMQVMSGVGVYQEPSGTIQVTADYNYIGDPDVSVLVLNNDLPSGRASITGGGVVVVGYDAGSGLPTIESVSMQVVDEPTFKIKFGSFMEFHLMEGPIFWGDEMHLIAAKATETIQTFGRVDVTGKHLVCFGLYDIDRNKCCRGMTGNVDCDVADFVTMGDLTVLIDHLFISLEPLCCPDEANMDLIPGHEVTMGDLTVLIDHLFISLDPLPPCP